MELTINPTRLFNNLRELAKIGMNSEGGIDRAFGSESDRQARNWLIKYWKNHLGIEARKDAIANLWLDWSGKKTTKPIVIGSHHDAVPSGGKYDGALGVLIATEILQTLIENNIHLEHPLSVISFTGEEPNPFNLSTLGSKVVSGRLKQENLIKSSHRDTAEALEVAVEKLGGNIHELENALLTDGSIGAFLECHIEQGKVLEECHLPVATVNCITGIHREEITVNGEANHAGTTKMIDRKDALIVASEVVLALEEALGSLEGIVGTIGYFKVEPNEANIIPGEVRMLLDMRTDQPQLQKRVLEEFYIKIKRIELKRKVAIENKVILEQPPMPMNPQIMKCVDEGIKDIGIENFSLVSMAGHDAANMARLTRSGMLFVRSVGGKSHCKEEYSTDEDIVIAANAMLKAVFHIDRELE